MIDRLLVCCSRIAWAFVAPHLVSGEARRGSIAAGLCDRGATKPEAKCDATHRAACLFDSDFVVRSLQTAARLLVAHASSERKIQSRK